LLPLIALVLLLLAFALPALAGAPAGAVPATLVDVIDGDTIDVLVNDQLERVRYIGVDTPERAQPGYLAATEANRTLLQAGLVTPSPLLYLVKDVSECDKTSDVRFAKIFRLFAVQAAQKRLGFWSRTPPQPDGAMSYALTTGPARVRQGPYCAAATTCKARSEGGKVRLRLVSGDCPAARP
jgi:endonuclease YncB( thermonuclease family)